MGTRRSRIRLDTQNLPRRIGSADPDPDRVECDRECSCVVGAACWRLRRAAVGSEREAADHLVRRGIESNELQPRHIDDHPDRLEPHADVDRASADVDARDGLLDPDGRWLLGRVGKWMTVVKNAASRLCWSRVWRSGCEAAWDLILARARVAESALGADFKSHQAFSS